MSLLDREACGLVPDRPRSGYGSSERVNVQRIGVDLRAVGTESVLG